jgi:hypothetical protein
MWRGHIGAAHRNWLGQFCKIVTAIVAFAAVRLIAHFQYIKSFQREYASSYQKDTEPATMPGR